jgi:hypothetical protein
MTIQSGQSQHGKIPGRCGPIKKFTVQIGFKKLFSFGVIYRALSQLDVICSGDRGRGLKLTHAATAAISINAREVVSQTFCIR